MPRTTFYAATYVVLHRLEDDAVLLIRRQNTGFADGHWYLPSGHIDEKEGPLLSASRECAEEVGVTVQTEDLKLFHVSHTPYRGESEAFGFFYKTTVWQGTPQNLEPEKCAEIGWFPLSNLPSPITGYVLTALQSLHDATVATPSHVTPFNPRWAS